MTYTYESLAQEVCVRGSHKVKVGQRDVGGTFDPITKILVWVVDYSVRDEAYIRALLDTEQRSFDPY